MAGVSSTRSRNMCRVIVGMMLAFAAMLLTLAPASADTSSYDDSHVNMYRLYNPNSGEHFYTSSLYEAQSVATAGWQWEGIGWVAPTENDRPVFRLYNPNAGDHHYTLSGYERDHLVSVGWNYEGIGWYSDAEDQVAVLREYNPNASSGAHNFTTSSYEDEYLGQVGWSREGIAWYATDGEHIAIEGFWLVTSAWGSLERYWIDSSANVAKGRLIDPAEGSGWWAYATGGGAVVRGKHDTGWGRVYVADSKGELASSASGADDWLVTDAYDGGLQRYRYDAASRAMVSGFFEVDGNKYFGVGGQGYVLRNANTRDGNQWYHADNDGVLSEIQAISGNSELDNYLLSIAEANGYDLWNCYNWMRDNTSKFYPSRDGVHNNYHQYGLYVSDDNSIYEAVNLFNWNGGDCYNDAAAMMWLARACGYEASMRCGHVPSSSQGSVTHGWVEVDSGGTRIIDVNLAKSASLSGYNWYLVTYDEAPIYYND